MRATTPRVASALAAVALVAASALITAPAASAHNYLVGSNPAAGSVITEVPEVFSVTTNEALLDLSGSAQGFAIQVTDAAGLYYGDGCGVVDGGTYASGATLGEAGAYRFLWQVISADGHTVSEEFTFTFEPSADATVSAGSPTAPVCGVAGAEPESTDEPTVEPDPTDTETATPISAPVEAAAVDPVPWVIGGLAVVVVGAIIAFSLMGRRKAGVAETDAETDVEPQSSPKD